MINIWRLALKTETVRVKEKSSVSSQPNAVAYEKKNACRRHILATSLWPAFLLHHILLDIWAQWSFLLKLFTACLFRYSCDCWQTDDFKKSMYIEHKQQMMLYSIQELGWIYEQIERYYSISWNVSISIRMQSMHPLYIFCEKKTNKNFRLF